MPADTVEKGGHVYVQRLNCSAAESQGKGAAAPGNKKDVVGAVADLKPGNGPADGAGPGA